MIPNSITEALNRAANVGPGLTHVSVSVNDLSLLRDMNVAQQEVIKQKIEDIFRMQKSSSNWADRALRAEARIHQIQQILLS